MGILDRFILAIYTLALIAVSLGVILFSLRLIPLEWVLTGLDYISGRWEASLVGALFLLLSIRLLLAGTRGRREPNVITQHTDMGTVQITLTAVESLVEKGVQGIRGIRGTNVNVRHSQAGLKIKLKVAVIPDINVPATTEEIQTKINETLKNTIGIEPTDIQVVVNSIANDGKVRRVE